MMTLRVQGLLLATLVSLAACGSSAKSGSPGTPGTPPNGSCTGTGQMICSGTCVSLSTDPDNCGSCGRSCGGAECEAGLCLPLVLAASQDSPDGIAVDSTSVYWTNQAGASSVLEISTEGGGMPTILATAQVLPSWIAVDGSGVYWVDDGVSGAGGGSVHKVGLTGGTTSQLGGMQGNISYFTADADRLYWTDTASIYSIGKDGTAPASLAAGGNFITTLAVDATDIYWADNGTSTVWKASKTDGSGKTMLTSSLSLPYAIAVDATSVYVNDNLNIDKMGLDGSGVKTLATAKSPPQVLVLDDTTIYWPDASDGLVMSVGKDGTNLTTLAATQDAPTDVAVDDTYVYWTNHGTMASGYTDGAVVRLAKPTAGTGGSTGGTSDQQLCAQACAGLMACGVPVQPTCAMTCEGSGVAVACFQGAGSDCNALATCALETELATSCMTSGTLGGTATCSATSTCELNCIQTGSCNPLCSCVPDLSADVAINLLINNECFTSQCATPCSSAGSGAACTTCFAQMCQTANQQCVAH